MNIKVSSLFRIKILMRRECLVWLKRKGESRVFKGWLLGFNEQRVLFKVQGETTSAWPVQLHEIDSLGCVAEAA
jgi:hypothetical protein